MAVGKSDDLALRFDAPEGGRAVVLEDDGRVAYAYLLDDEKIVADVWLYNVAPTPDEPEWRNPSRMPFLNPLGFCAPHAFRLSRQTSVECRWLGDGTVEVVFDRVLFARLRHGSKPGWSRFAAQPGPLAKPLDDAPSHSRSDPGRR